MNSFKKFKGNIVMADLTSFPELRLGNLEGGESLAECRNNKAELYLNRKKMTLARYPNIGSDGFWRFLNTADGSPLGWDLIYNSSLDEKMVAWASEKDLWLHGYWRVDWADNHVRVSDIVPSNRSIIFDRATPTEKHKVLKNARFYALNAMSELDSPGEYYIDRDNKKLYFQPPTALKSSDVVMLSNLSIVVQASNTSGIHLEGMDLSFGSSGNIYWDNVTDSTVRDCNVGLTGGTALYAMGERLKLINNTAVDIGCIGFSVHGGSVESLTSGQILVENNRIESFSQWKRTYQPGLRWSGDGNVYRGNVVRDGPHNGAQGGGNDNLFDGNHFDTLAYECDDTGAWYSFKGWAKRNNTLVNNVFVNIRNKVKTFHGYPGVQAVYNDDQLSGNTFRNNTFIDCYCGIFMSGGRSHVIEKNHFIRTATPVHLDNRGTRGKHRLDCMPPNGTFFQELKAFRYKEPPYSTRYPELVNVADDRPCYPVHNVITDNTYCGSDIFADFTSAEAAVWNTTLKNNVLRSADCKVSKLAPTAFLI